MIENAQCLGAKSFKEGEGVGSLKVSNVAEEPGAVGGAGTVEGPNAVGVPGIPKDPGAAREPIFYEMSNGRSGDNGSDFNKPGKRGTKENRKGSAATGTTRREQLVACLEQAAKPLSGQALGEKLQVSRQVIVTDIALLRACGHDIISTNRGYILKRVSTQVTRLVKVRHTPDQIEEEMNAIVDLGGCVVDVMVNHRTYGRLSAPLDIKSRRDVRQFLSDLQQGVSAPLSMVTNGYHFHHISADSEDILDEIVSALDKAGFLAPLTAFESQELFGKY